VGCAQLQGRAGEGESTTVQAPDHDMTLPRPLALNVVRSPDSENSSLFIPSPVREGTTFMGFLGLRMEVRLTTLGYSN
jgi:hypothetical protein